MRLDHRDVVRVDSGQRRRVTGPLAIGRKQLDLKPEPLKSSDGIQDGPMFRGQAEDSSSLLARVKASSQDCQVIALRGTAGHDQFGRQATEKPRHILQSGGHLFGDFSARDVGRTGGIREPAAPKRRHGFEDFGGNRSGCMVVKIDHRWVVASTIGIARFENETFLWGSRENRGLAILPR